MATEDSTRGDGDEEFEEDEPLMDTSHREAIIVDGLPAVPKEKCEKLTNVIRKFFSQVGEIVTLSMPTDDSTGTSLGYAFIEFAKEEEAKAAITKANGYKLDKSHTFIVNAFSDYNKYLSIPEEEVTFDPPPYVPKEDLHSWLMDSAARDQLVMRFNEETEIWWNDATLGKPDLPAEHSRHNWSDSYVSWSPRGTYLATFHRLGIQLWGGVSWKKLFKINHGGVKLLDFSPCENFVITWSPEGDQREALIVWDVKTGSELRRFQGIKEGADAQMQWPAFRWSFDDQFFARIGDDCIYVYESSTMKLIKDKGDKRSSIKVDGVHQFMWSPTDLIVSMWIPEHMNQPAKVVLMELPSRQELRQKNLFSVADLRMTWHDQGHFLCVKVDKHSKSKKTLNSAFELFRLRDKGVPIEVLEFNKDTTIFAMSWEPKGLRFAVILGEGSGNRMDVAIHTMSSKCNGRTSLLKTFEKKSANSLFWSPAGGILLLANLKGTSGQLEWVDVNVNQTIGEAEHFMCSDIEWDPTGRYVATSVSHWRHQMENGWQMWSSHGRNLGHCKKEKFFQLLWRPRPPSLLSEAKEKEVRKNLRSYSKRYEEEDLAAKRSMQGDVLKQRREKHEAFEQFLKVKADEYKAQRAARLELRGGIESDNESAYTLIEDVDEVELSYKEEIIEAAEIEIGDD